MQLDKNTTLVWDCDNTLWGWTGYAGPAYEAMCEVLAKVSGKMPDETALAMKAFYTRVGTLEHEGLVQALDKDGFFRHLPNFDLNETIVLAQRAFSEERDRHFQVYDGIAEIVQEIKALGVRQVLLTDATGYQAKRRLARSGLTGFDKLYSLRTAQLEDMPPIFGATGRSPQLPHEELDEEKPNTDLEKVLGLTRNEIAERAAVIGDSVKDMTLAERFGCVAVHTLYGLPSKDSLAPINRFASTDVARKNTSILSTANNYSRLHSVNHPSEILAALRAA